MSSLPFIPVQHSMDSIFTTISSSLSLLGCLFIIIAHIKFKEKEFIVKLVFILAINDLIISIIFLISTQLNITHYNDIVNQHLPFICSVPDTLLHYFFISSFFWNVSIAHTLLQASKYHNHLNVDKYYKYYHIISWGVPFVLIAILFILRIVKKANCLTYSEIYPHLLFFIPLVGCWVYNIVVSVLVTRSLRRQGAPRQKIILDDSDSDEEEDSNSNNNGSSNREGGIGSLLLSYLPIFKSKKNTPVQSSSNISINNNNNNNRNLNHSNIQQQNRPYNNNIKYTSFSPSPSPSPLSKPKSTTSSPLSASKNNIISVSDSIDDIHLLDESTPKLVRTSIYYLMAFAICWIWSIIVVFFVTLQQNNPLQYIFLTLTHIWVPLQGFLNAIIYGLHDILWSKIRDRIRSRWGRITISPSPLDGPIMQSKLLIDSFYEDEDGDEDKLIFKHQHYYDHDESDEREGLLDHHRSSPHNNN